MKNHLQLTTKISESNYGPENPEWSFNSTGVLHKMSHIFEFTMKDGNVIQMPIYHLFEFAKFFDLFETNGQAMEALFHAEPKPTNKE